MDRKFSELRPEELTRLPRISDRNWIGEETIYLHLQNSKNMNWYLAEYDHTRRKFFGFSDKRSEGIFWGLIELEELLGYEKKGVPWEVLVDGSWRTAKSKEIHALQGYIRLMLSMSDTL